MTSGPTWIEQFPGNFVWSNAALVTKGMAPYGAVALGEIDEVCERLRSRQGEPDAWHQEWCALGERLERVAAAAAAEGREMTAGNYYLRTGMYYFTGERFVPPGDLKREIGQKALGCQHAGLRRRYPAMEFVEVPYENTTLPALFMPARGITGRAPTVVVFDGMDNCKEMSVLFCSPVRAAAVPSYASEDLLAAVAALAPSLRSAADEIERGRTLPEPLVQAMVDAGLYRMFLPRSLGGGEVDPLTYFDVVEALTRADSTAGWSVLISTSVIAGTVRALPDETLAAMFTTPRDTIMCGSGPPRGRVHEVPGGYRLTGQWSQGSNILIARWLHVGSHLYDGDQPCYAADGRPIYLVCALPTSEARVLDTWDTTGMRGTGSHDYTVTDVFVPAARVHPVVDPSPRRAPLYQFVGWTHVAHAALGLGIARVAVEEFIAVATGKVATWFSGEGALATRTTIQSKVAQAEALIGSGRAYVREATRETWETISRGERLSPTQRAIYRLAIAQAMTHAVQAVDLMYSAGGATSIYATSRLDRCLRDVRTAAAHVWVAPDNYELAGRLLLGLDPGSTTI